MVEPFGGFFFKKNNLLFFFLAVPSLSCGMQDLEFQHVNS